MNNYHAYITDKEGIQIPGNENEIFLRCLTLEQARYKIDQIGRFKKGGYYLFVEGKPNPIYIRKPKK